MHAHRRGFDLTALTGPQADVLVPALHACTFPTGRIVNRAGAAVPVAVADLSRFSGALEASGHGHAHVSPPSRSWSPVSTAEHAHLLGEPVPPGAPVTRRAPLGLYWLPTRAYPAGRIEVGTAAMASPDLAREVLLAEAAHSVDYGAMTDSQRERIMLLFDHVGTGPPPQGWFEELGEGSYWAFRGEAWMSLFISAFSDLPQPLKARQPWEWSFDDSDVRRVRSILRRPSS